MALNLRPVILAQTNQLNEMAKGKWAKKRASVNSGISGDNRGKNNTKRPKTHKNDNNGEWVLTNEKFESFYKAQGIVPESQWDEFLEAYRRSLPTTFRINATCPFADKIRERVGRDFQFSDVRVNEDLVGPVSTICWYPEGNAFHFKLDRRFLGRVPDLKNLKSFLQVESERGNITRQEAVSMIPPFFLQVEPHHLVLDMCAAPGSKTSQLLEMLHASEGDRGDCALGAVVANDVDTQRAYMLVHQCKRIGSPSLMVTCHNAQWFPNLNQDFKISRAAAAKEAVEKETAAGASGEGEKEEAWEKMPRSTPGCFDRVLADVPCSGDGTLRKNPEIWRKWVPSSGGNLHALQAQIGMRGAALLKVGGLMVYSTCSLSPAEDEAVVAELLRRCGGALELMDVSDQLPGLRRRAGLHTWKVFTDDMVELRSPDDVEEKYRQRYRPGLWPPSAEVASSMNLERCMRCLPHDQDTGGFFIAVLRKTKDLPTAPVISRPNRIPPRKWREEESKGNCNDKVVSSSSATEGGESDIAAAPAVAIATAEAGQEKKGEGGKVSKGRSAYTRQKEEYIPFPAERWARIAEHYGVAADAALDGGQLFTRNDMAKSVVYVPPAVRDNFLLKADSHKLKVVHTGLKVFERNPNETSQDGSNYRLAQEGIHLVLPSISKRVMSLGLDDFVTLVRRRGAHVPLEKFSDEIRASFEGMSIGSVAVMLRGSSSHRSHLKGVGEVEEKGKARNVTLLDGSESGGGSLGTARMVVVVWRGRSSINVMVNKVDCGFILSQLFDAGLITKEQSVAEELEPKEKEEATK